MARRRRRSIRAHTDVFAWCRSFDAAAGRFTARSDLESLDQAPRVSPARSSQSVCWTRALAGLRHGRWVVKLRFDAILWRPDRRWTEAACWCGPRTAARGVWAGLLTGLTGTPPCWPFDGSFDAPSGSAPEPERSGQAAAPSLPLLSRTGSPTNSTSVASTSSANARANAQIASWWRRFDNEMKFRASSKSMRCCGVG